MVSRTTTSHRHALSVRLRGKRFATLLTASHMHDDYYGDTFPASEELLLMESDVNGSKILSCRIPASFSLASSLV
ncbi:hypothetical protein HBI34_206700 [Parastagonospora nodorum]|nr:hypothetical protein HBI34_206700 [Parastagonospora nodorum]